MGIRSLLRNLFGRNRSAEPNQKPEPSPAEHDAAPQAAQQQHEHSGTSEKAGSASHVKEQVNEGELGSEQGELTAANVDPQPETALSEQSDQSDESPVTAEARNSGAVRKADEKATGAGSANDADEVEDDDRVPSPRSAAHDGPDRGPSDADERREKSVPAPADEAEAAPASARTASEDFLDSVADAGRGEPSSSRTAAKQESATAETAEGDSAGATGPGDSESDAESADPAKAPAEQDATATEPVVSAGQRIATVPQQASSPTEATTKATTETSQNAVAAVSLEKVEATAPTLVSLYKAAAVSLEKHGLAGQRAAVYLVLDRSGSMRRYYKDGTVQHLAEQVLGLSAHLDDDGTVPVIFFSTDIDGVDEIDLGNHTGRVDELHSSYGHMGRTNYHRAMEAVVEHYENSGSSDPALVIFQTDGAPTSRALAEKALCEAADKPLFWQFIGFGDPKSAGLNFLRKLDAGLPVPEKRSVDNAGFFHAGLEPRSLSDGELYDALTQEFPHWLRAVREARIHA